jgi:8-oxo-dGTP diphosphatase
MSQLLDGRGRRDLSYELSDLQKTAQDDGIAQIVVGLLVFDSRGRVLALKRKSDDFLGGLWELPSGKVEAGETLLQACARELQEETGLLLKDLRDYIGSFDYASESGRKSRQLNFLLEVEGDNHALSNITHPEHAESCWIESYSVNSSLFNFSEQTKRVIAKAFRLGS